MKAPIPKACSRARPLARIALITACAMAVPGAPAATVEYTKICDLFGVGYSYIPGSDYCYDESRNDVRESVNGGIWRWRAPNNPWTWTSRPADACPNGQLFKFADITGTSLHSNDQWRFETNKQLSFGKGQYIAAVIYQGGLTGLSQHLTSELPACPSANAVVTDATDASCTAGNAPAGGGGAQCEVACANGAWAFASGPPRYTVDDLPACPAPNAVVTDATDADCTPGDAPVGGDANACDVACRGDGWEFQPRSFGGIARKGNFCLFYHYYDPGRSDYVYAPLGCIDTAPQASLPQALAFVPDEPEPPVPWRQVDILGASGDIASTLSNSDIHGRLSIWLCLRATPRG